MNKSVAIGVSVLAVAAAAGGFFLYKDKQPQEPKLAAVAPAVRLVTQDQYLNTLKAVFGENLRYPKRLAPMKRVDGLATLGAGSAIVTGGALDQYDDAARSIAAQVVDPAHRDYLIPCKPEANAKPDDACAGEFLSRTGRLLYRRALTETERKVNVAVARESAEKLGGFYQGLSAALAGMLVSPEFLFVTQPVEADPDNHGHMRLTDAGKAARLSLLLWNAYPDDELLTAAEKGELNTRRGLIRQVDRMMASPRVGTAVRSFFSDMMIFDVFDTLTKDPVIYPAFTAKVVEDAREQTLRTIVSHVVDENADYRDLFTTRKTFLTGDIGSIYRIPVDQPGKWSALKFDAGSPHAGILTELAFLSVYAHPGRSSPTRRGRAVREIFLCQKVPDPPPNVDFTGFEAATGKTTRERLAAHSTNPVCAGCHKITDPIGLAFESFDGAGQYRMSENNAQIDTSGNLDGKSYADAAGLGQAIHDHPQTPLCLVNRFSSYALGRPVQAGDKDWVNDIGVKFAAGGYKVKNLMRTIATSESFYSVPDTLDPAPAKAEAAN